MLEMIWGGFLVLLGLIAWLGQLIYAISPEFGARIGVGEAESDVDPVIYIDARGEAIWDSIFIWILPLAGMLLILHHPYWPYFALVGGGSYLYFAGRHVVVNTLMQQHDVQIGTPGNKRIAYIFITLWGVAAVITIVMAVRALEG